MPHILTGKESLSEGWGVERKKEGWPGPPDSAAACAYGPRPAAGSSGMQRAAQAAVTLSLRGGSGSDDGGLGW
eukprot:766862-Hanusia_phi.AAC.8